MNKILVTGSDGLVGSALKEIDRSDLILSNIYSANALKFKIILLHEK